MTWEQMSGGSSRNQGQLVSEEVAKKDESCTRQKEAEKERTPCRLKEENCRFLCYFVALFGTHGDTKVRNEEEDEEVARRRTQTVAGWGAKK